MAGRVDFGIRSNLGNVEDPTLAQDAATKNYVDSSTGGIFYDTAAVFSDVSVATGTVVLSNGITGSVSSTLVQTTGAPGTEAAIVTFITNRGLGTQVWAFAGFTNITFTIISATANNGRVTINFTTPLALGQTIIPTSAVLQYISVPAAYTPIRDLFLSSGLLGTVANNPLNRPTLSLGLNPFTVATIADAEILSKWGGLDAVTRDPDTTAPIIANVSASTIIFDDRSNSILIGNYLWINSTATNNNGTLVYAASGVNSGFFQYTITTVGNPIDAGFTPQAQGVWYSKSSDPFNNFIVSPTGANKVQWGTIAKPLALSAANSLTAPTNFTVGTPGQVLTSAGPGRSPSWQFPTGAGSSAIDLGQTYVAGSVGVMVRVDTTTPTVSNVAGSFVTPIIDFGSINITSTPWPITIPTGYNTFFLVIEASDFSWSGVGEIQITPPALIQVAWIRRPTAQSSTTFTNARVWACTNAVGSIWAAPSVSAIAGTNPNTALVFPDLVANSITEGIDNFGGNSASLQVVPTIDNEIARLVGSIDPILTFADSAIPLIVSFPSTTQMILDVDSQAQAQLLLNRYLWRNANGTNNGTTDTLFVTAVQQQGVTQFQARFTVQGNFSASGWTTAITTIYYSRGAPAGKYTFVPAPQTEIIRLAQANDVSSLNSLQGPVTLVPGTNVEITTSGQNITISSSGGGGTGGGIPVINFTASAAGGSNQTFTNSLLATYLGPDYISVTVNGSALNRTNYGLSGQTLTVIGYLSPNANVQVQPSGSSGSGGGGWQVGGNSFGDGGAKLLGSITNNNVSLISKNTEVARLTAGFAISSFQTNLPPAIIPTFNGYWNQSNGSYAAFSGVDASTTLYYSSTGPMGFSAVTLPRPNIYCGVQWTSSRMVFGTDPIDGASVSMLVQNADSATAFTRQDFAFDHVLATPTLINDIDFSLDGTKIAFLATGLVQTDSYLFYANNFTVGPPIVVGAIRMPIASNQFLTSVQWLDNINVAVTDNTARIFLVNTVTSVVTNPLTAGLFTRPIESTLINNNLFVMTNAAFYFVNRSNPTIWTEEFQIDLGGSFDWGTEDVLFNIAAGGIFYFGSDSDSSTIYTLTAGAQFLVTNGALVLGNQAGTYGSISAANAPSPTALTFGGPGQALLSSGPGPAYWGSPALAFAGYRLLSDQSITGGTQNTIQFYFAPFVHSTPEGNFGSMNNSGVFTFSRSGVYMITYQWDITQNPDGWGIISGNNLRICQHNGALKGSSMDIVRITSGQTLTVVEINGGTVSGGDSTATRLYITQVG